jgi:hypothetical protein
MNSSDAGAMAQALGLSPGQAAQFSDCLARGGVGLSGSMNGPNGQPGTSALGQRQFPPRRFENSSIETRFHDLDHPYRLYDTPTTKSLEQFGYDLFESQVSTFAPFGSAPVGGDYILGPDDELNVYTWGRVNQTLHLKVDRAGIVMVPEIGPVQVSGLTFSQAKKLIEGRMGQITGVEVDVTMGQVRTIQVFVIGKVTQPGLYSVSALSHVSNALVAAGGVSKMGSLRRGAQGQSNHRNPRPVRPAAARRYHR